MFSVCTSSTVFDSESKQANKKQLKNKTQNFSATKYPVFYLIPSGYVRIVFHFSNLFLVNLI